MGAHRAQKLCEITEKPFFSRSFMWRKAELPQHQKGIFFFFSAVSDFLLLSWNRSKQINDSDDIISHHIRSVVG